MSVLLLYLMSLSASGALSNPPAAPASTAQPSANPAAPGAEVPPTASNPITAVAAALETGISFEDARKLRDPFKRPISASKAVTKKSPLEASEITEFKVQGVVAGNRRVAILVGPGNKSFFVQAGQKIGPRGGVITKITPESIEITERKVDDLGDNLEEVTYLKVPQEGAQNQQGQELIERVVRETGQQGQPSQEQR
jgi:Tfp pilus assembly protein PilP